jgi:hypothetical protein
VSFPFANWTQYVKFVEMGMNLALQISIF